MSTSKTVSFEKTTVSSSLYRQFAPEDWTMPLRFVGTFEYLNAITDFRELVSISAEEELKVYDELLQEQTEYSFFSGELLNQLFGKYFESTGARSEPKDLGGGKDRFRRNSLAWMMALARVELGATLAMYGRLDNPFEFVGTTGYGAEEFNRLLIDDALAHISAIQTDAEFKRVSARRSAGDSDTIAYLRRLRVIRDMLNYGSQLAGFTQEQLRPWYAKIEKVQKRLESKVLIAELDMHGTEFRRSEKKEKAKTEYSNVVARQPITRYCQRNFLQKYGRGRDRPQAPVNLNFDESN